jgi:catechol 2,3-dioxygenase
MTAIRGVIGVNKRPGELGVHSLDMFRMAVPDLTVAQKFYTDFGLDVREEGNGLGLYTHGNPHRWISLSEGAKKKLQGFCFGLFEEDLGPMKQRIEAAGVRLLDPPAGAEGDGLWFHDNNGLLVELRVAAKTSLDAKASFGSMDQTVPANTIGSWSRAVKPHVQPLRFAHMLVFTPSVQSSIEFYSRVLGLRLADRTGDAIAFMYGIHGSDHHMIAFVTSGGKPAGLHHCSWDMGSINGIGLAAQQMADAGYTEGWGLGRHVLGSNYFHYMKDPWGSWAEYSADIDYIAVDHDWQAKDHPPEDGIYVWGPELPKDFVHNYEADQ